MNKSLGFVKKLWQGLDRIVVTQRLRCETDVYNGASNTTRGHQRHMELRFSVKQAVLVLGAVGMFVFSASLLWKKCVEHRLLVRLKKKYFFLPADRVAQETKEQH